MVPAAAATTSSTEGDAVVETHGLGGANVAARFVFAQGVGEAHGGHVAAFEADPHGAVGGVAGPSRALPLAGRQSADSDPNALGVHGVVVPPTRAERVVVEVEDEAGVLVSFLVQDLLVVEVDVVKFDGQGHGHHFVPKQRVARLTSPRTSALRRADFESIVVAVQLQPKEIGAFHGVGRHKCGALEAVPK